MVKTLKDYDLKSYRHRWQLCFTPLLCTWWYDMSVWSQVSVWESTVNTDKCWSHFPFVIAHIKGILSDTSNLLPPALCTSCFNHARTCLCVYKSKMHLSSNAVNTTCDPDSFPRRKTHRGAWGDLCEQSVHWPLILWWSGQLRNVEAASWNNDNTSDWCSN